MKTGFRTTAYLRILSGRQLEGNIDFYGHNSVAGGWIFCGWASEPWGETSVVSVVAHFQNGDVAGELLSAFYHRSNLKGRGTGLVLFVHGKHEALGALVYTDVRLNGSNLMISATPTAYQKGDQEILLTVRSLLAAQQEAENYRELTPFYRQAVMDASRQSLNVLNGYVDS